MKCPVCQTVDLKLSERQGVEIDYCPNCRGVWLDRGELDKIIERMAAAGETYAPPPRQQPPPARDQRDQGYRYGDDDDLEHRRYGGDPRYKPKRKSMLGDLFDIFD
ncbi:MAG: zf-TFIIB domain-containing protein [Anaerolineae bacterium]|nr:zf-TFIIB domain-containing protein [Anaerolineae bacterium]NUQ03572.1 zf-TFIIB domain-containing protein [Anaerolineae bacterium]